MRSQLLAVLAGLLLTTGGLAAFDVVATLINLDADKGVVQVRAGQERTVPVAKGATVLDTDGKPLAGGLKAKELKDGAVVTLTAERGTGGPEVRAIRLGGPARPRDPGRPRPPQANLRPRPTTGLKPLTEMTADDRYKGEDGGLYGGGHNEPRGEFAAAAQRESAKVAPLDTDGRPATDGIIGLISLSMSNATQEYAVFKQIADRDPAKSPRVTVVDCAQGGQTMARWSDPKAACWVEADRRLRQSGVSPKQVQVAWIKLANAGPSGELNEHGKQLQKDTVTVLHNAKARFPNLRVAYLGSRIYAGYASTPLNPEPYAYEGAFVCRWLIQDQAKGNADLNFDLAKGEVKAPLLLWGPYLWADGTTRRQEDGLVWERADLADGDGTHPSETGRRKVADLLLTFFKNDATAKGWFLRR
jgi:hypothetical protein